MAFARVLYAFSAVCLLVGGVVHARAYRGFDAALLKASLPPFYSNASRGLWLIDSTTQMLLAVAFALLAIRPSAAPRSVVVVVGLVPLATAALIYRFLGPFPAGHVLACAGLAAIIAAALR